MARAGGAAFFSTWNTTRRRRSPLASSAVGNSWLMTSSTVERTSRPITPIGIIDSVATGRIRQRSSSQFVGNPPVPPIPAAGSVFAVDLAGADPRRNCVQLAGLRAIYEPRDLPSRHPGAAGYRRRARLVLRADQPGGRCDAG